VDGKPPPRRQPADLAGYLEALSRPVFQAGISRPGAGAKRDGIRDSFAGFTPQVVASYGPDDIGRLLAGPRVIPSKTKTEATIDNAQALPELDAGYGGFDRYLRSHGGFDQTAADLNRQFRFTGDSGARHFLRAVSEPAPPHDEWPGARQRQQRTRGGGGGSQRPMAERTS
jgi:3-methyladenine DNA glycosylase Tag